MNFVSPDPEKPFYPIRAGHMKLIELSVVDAFGQTLKLPAVDAPIRAASLRIEGEENKPFIRFAPRSSLDERIPGDDRSPDNDK